MKKQLLLFVLTIGLCINAYAQENEELDILEADSTWLKEIIKFPFGFAPEINLKGYEDLRFAKDWSKPERQEFFTYAFVWNTNLTEAPTVNMLESNMRLYYDGLMTAVNKDKDFTIPKSTILFVKSEENNDEARFVGKMKVYDSFFTKKTITLHVKVDSFYCESQKRYLVFFRVSSKAFENSIWDKLKTVKLSSDACDISSN